MSCLHPWGRRQSTKGRQTMKIMNERLGMMPFFPSLKLPPPKKNSNLPRHPFSGAMYVSLGSGSSHLTAKINISSSKINSSHLPRGRNPKGCYILQPDVIQVLSPSKVVSFKNVDVSLNGGTPKSTHFNRVFHINHPFWGVSTIFGTPHVMWLSKAPAL